MSKLSLEEKLLKMFNILHPEKLTQNFRVEVVEGSEWDQDPQTYIKVLNDEGNLCWGYTKEELLFEYVTRDF